MKTVSFYPEDVDALSRALASLQADMEIVERLGVHSVELQVAIENVEGLRDRMLAEQNELRARLASHPFDLKQWVENNIVSPLRSAS